MQQWIDIPGVTESSGQPRLPADPHQVVGILRLVVALSDAGVVEFRSLVDLATSRTGTPTERVAGLAGWLPMSRMARWSPDGHLWLHAYTDATDLSLRYAAWVSSQLVPRRVAKQVTEYAQEVVRLAVSAAASDAPRQATLTEAPITPPPALAPPDAPLVPPALTEKLRQLLGVLDASFLERRAHVRSALLALLAGQHVLLLGPPGTAKSMLARALCDAFADARYFEYLLSRFTHPDELFGPVSIPGLKEEDYRRLTEGFLPQAHVAFLDEIFKANSAILNSLLTLINERVFHHGRHRDPVPLLGLVGASNELPDADGGLEALFDRFLVRLSVPPVADAGAFLAVATGTLHRPEVPAGLRITADDLEVLRVAAAGVEVPAGVAESLVALWDRARQAEWQVSDRRWRQAVHLLRVAAAADGRRRVEPLDLLLLEAVLAPTPAEVPEARAAILDRIAPGVVPSHDLRAQWLLLEADLVAPTLTDILPTRPEADAPWPRRLEVRRRSVRRFLGHHRETVEGLSVERQRLESLGEHHLWLPHFPVEMLAAHISAARDLAAILAVAEQYADQVAEPRSLAKALLLGLDEPSRRAYGSHCACRIVLSDAGLEIGLTARGERVRPHRAAPPERVVSSSSDPPQSTRPRVPTLLLSSAQLLDWLDGRTTTGKVLGMPTWAGRDAKASLETVRQSVGGVIPQPPELPAP